MTSARTTTLPSTPARPPEQLAIRDPWTDERGRMHVSRHADVEAMLRADSTSLDMASTPGFDPQTCHPSMLFLWATDEHRRADGTPGRHGPMRDLLIPWIGAPTVSPRSEHDRTPRMVELARAAVDRLPERFEVYRDLTVPVMTELVAELMGTTPAKVTWLLDAQRAEPSLDDTLPMQRTDYDADLLDLLDNPAGPGLLSAMREAADRGDLTEREAIGIAWATPQASVLNAAATSAGAVGLLVEHGEWAPPPSTVPTAVEEAARLLAPFPISIRYVTAPTPLPSGVVVPAGTLCLLRLDAANRDPDRFPDPARFDPHRPAGHLSWSVGRHRCTGIAVARAAIAAVVGALADSRPHLSLDGPWQRYTGTEDGWTATPVRTEGDGR
ncbi:MAG: cytochrome P450 [Dermatophilaceae bacterium]